MGYILDFSKDSPGRYTNKFQKRFAVIYNSKFGETEFEKQN